MGAGGGSGVQGHPELQTALTTSLSYLKPGLKAPENEKGGGGGGNPIAIKPQKVIKSQQQQQNNSAANWEGIRVETSQQKRQNAGLQAPFSFVLLVLFWELGFP